MTTIVKTLTVLAVHGDTDRESVQRVLDEKSRRAPPKGHEGPHDHLRGPFLKVEDFPPAECNAVVVAEGTDGDNTRVELYLTDFDHVEGIKQGGAIRVSFEVAE